MPGPGARTVSIFNGKFRATDIEEPELLAKERQHEIMASTEAAST